MAHLALYLACASTHCCLPPAAKLAPAVQRKGGKHYNPWTPELQQQLATVLRSTLGYVACLMCYCCLMCPLPGDAACHHIELKLYTRSTWCRGPATVTDEAPPLPQVSVHCAHASNKLVARCKVDHDVYPPCRLLPTWLTTCAPCKQGNTSKQWAPRFLTLSACCRSVASPTLRSC